MLGEVLLTKKRVLIETDRKICLSCHRNSCLHYQAYEMCLEFQTLNIAESKNHANGLYFTLGANTIFLIKNGHHCFYKRERKWLTTGLMLPMALKPEISYCKEGYKYNIDKNLVLANANKGIIVYTENDVLEFKEYKGLCYCSITHLLSFLKPFIVYTSTCEGKCKCKSVFEGDKYLLLNVNNHYFIHYGVLFEYSELMTMSRNTLHGYMRFVYIFTNLTEYGRRVMIVTNIQDNLFKPENSRISHENCRISALFSS